MKHCLLFSILLFPLGLSAQTILKFTEIAPAAGINFTPYVMYEFGGGAAFLDYDNDGNLDIYVTGGMRKDKLFRNNGDGTFSDVSFFAGVGNPNFDIITLGVIVGDYDNDGDTDIFVTTEKSFRNLLLRNNGDGTFTDVTLATGLQHNLNSCYTASFGDYDKDGFLDIITSEYVDEAGFTFDSLSNVTGFAHKCYQNSFYRNNGNGTFTEMSQILGIIDTGCTLSITFTDFDRDGDMDILSGNDFGAWVVPNKLFRNNYPLNSFSDVSDTFGINNGIYSMGIAVGDYDQDMDLDYYITNIGRNSLFKNQGAAGFDDVADLAGVDDTYNRNNVMTAGWGTGFLDIDNDSYLDLFVANGFMPAAAFIWNDSFNYDALYYNNGNGTFTDIADTLGVDKSQICHGFAYGDYDNDGDLDMIVVAMITDTSGSGWFPWQNGSRVFLYRNDTESPNHWLQVKLEGVQTNRDAYGCQIEIYLPSRSWVHEVSGGDSHLSHHSSIAHFGLGQDTIVDSLVIRWLNSPAETYYNIPANQRLYLIEGTAPPPPTLGRQETLYQEADFLVFPNPTQDICQLQYRLDAPAKLSLSLYNALGQRLDYRSWVANSAGTFRETYSLEELPVGWYKMVLSIDNQNFVKTIIRY